MMTKRLPLLPLLVVLGACTDLDVLPEGARVTCANDDECPDDFTCRAALGRCVPDADLDKPPIDFDDPPRLIPEVVSHVDGFERADVIATLSETPAEPPTATVDGAPLECDLDGRVLVCGLDARALELDEGLHTVTVRAVDRAGNELREALFLEVDLTPPGLLSAPDVSLATLPGRRTLPDALGQRGRAEVALFVDELLSALPAVRLAGAPELSLFAISSPNLDEDLGFTYALFVNAASAPAQGPREIEIDLVDRAGNATTVATGAIIVIDTLDPAPPDVDTAGAVVFSRAPWGSGDDPTGAFRVTGAAGATEPGALVVVHSDTDIFLDAVIANGLGAFDIALPNLDTPRVRLQAIDPAGNESAFAAVRDIRWTASLGGKVRGSLAENPHQLFTSDYFEPESLRLNLRDEPLEVGALVGGQASLTVGSIARFSEVRLDDAGASPLFRGGVAYHAGRGAVMIQGGQTGDFNQLSDRLYEIVGDRWVEVTTSVRRPPAGSTLLTYDWTEDRLIAVAGVETWVFSGGQWTELPTTAPFGAGLLAYDRARRRAVLKTPQQTQVLEDDAWRPIAGAEPPERVDFGLAYDASRGGVILHGGAVAGVNVGEIWLLEGEGWIQVGDDLAKSQHVLVEDPRDGAVYAVGGACTVEFCLGPTGELHRLDGDTFTELGEFPVALSFHQAVVDPRQDRLLWISGINPLDFPFALPQAVYLARSLGGAGVADLNATPATGSGARAESRSRFDPIAGELLIFAGEFRGGDFIAPVDSVFAWDGTTNRPLDSLTGFDVAPFFDGASFRVLADGGLFRRVGDTWTSEALPAGLVPGAALAYHAGLDLTVGFGGNNTDETFTLRGADLTPLSPVNRPPPLNFALAVYDELRDAVIVYGNDETWSFDGVDWTLLDADGPGRAHDLVYDGVAHRTLLVRSSELHVLTDDGWVTLPHETEPNRFGVALGFDAARGELIAQGGTLGLTSIPAVFRFDGDLDARPVHTLRVDLDQRRAAAGSVISALEIHAVAGGRGHALVGQAREARPGVEVHGWGDLWRALGASETNDADAPGDFDVEVTAAADLTALTRGDLFLALTPLHGQGPGDTDGSLARLSTEAFEVTVVYRE